VSEVRHGQPAGGGRRAPGLVLGIALGLGALSGCDQTPDDLGPFSVRLVLDERPGTRCHSAQCDDYGMSCGAVLSLRIRDVENDFALVADVCEEIPPAQSLCELGNIRRPVFNIPPHRVRIEVAAWRYEAIAPEPGNALACPEGLFADTGVPRLDFLPEPAFAGSAFFDAGSSETVAEVRLSCGDASQLDQDECGMAVTTLVRASVEDIETGLDITSQQAQSLTVGAAEPRAVPDDQGGTVMVIESGDTIALSLLAGPVPIYANEVDRSFGSTLCAVMVDLSPQSTASVGCRPLSPGQNPIDLRGVLVTKQVLDQILGAMGAPGFPAEGLVVGRVVDHTGAPLSQVAVTPAAGAVQYLSPDRSALIGSETSSSGYFIARDVPFGTSWTAIHSVDGRREEGDVRAGLVNGKLTSFLVRMQAP
jgi:hypothetical protein